MTIWTIALIHLGIGVVLALSPLGRAEIAEQVRQVRGNPLVNAVTGREAPPAWKVVVFGVLVVLAIVLLWPMFLVSRLQGQAWERKEQRAWEARVAQGLEYKWLGGAGEISCQDCGFRQEITSFTHGFTSGPEASCTEGWQCLVCGKFHDVERRGNPPLTPVPRCECGGELSREHFLFCPQCRSRKLRYQMAYIT